jgi:hypothetical protein
MCGVKKDIQSCYTYAFWRYEARVNERRPHLTGTEVLLARKILEGLKPLGLHTGLSTGQIRRTSTHDHERNHTQSPSADRTSFFELLFAGWINWVLASSSLVGELLVLLAKLEFSWLYRHWISDFESYSYADIEEIQTIVSGVFFGRGGWG